LAQPIRRSSIFLGQYLGVAISLALSLVLGLGIPFIVYGLFESAIIWDFVSLITTGVFLTFIFTALAFNIALSNENKIKGFSYAILMWLFLAVIYDGLFLLSLVYFQEYPLDKFSLVATMLNPIDLSRILIILKLDIAALLGYTGAVFKQFFGTGLGFFLAMGMLTLWVILPVLRMVSVAQMNYLNSGYTEKNTSSSCMVSEEVLISLTTNPFSRTTILFDTSTVCKRS